MLPFCFSPPVLFLSAFLLYPASLRPCVPARLLEQGKSYVIVTICGTCANIFPFAGPCYAYPLAARSQPRRAEA